jgi:hypothetical protein
MIISRGVKRTFWSKLIGRFSTVPDCINLIARILAAPFQKKKKKMKTQIKNIHDNKKAQHKAQNCPHGNLSKDNKSFKSKSKSKKIYVRRKHLHSFHTNFFCLNKFPYHCPERKFSSPKKTNK